MAVAVAPVAGVQKRASRPQTATATNRPFQEGTVLETVETIVNTDSLQYTKGQLKGHIPCLKNCEHILNQKLITQKNRVCCKNIGTSL